MTLALRIVEAVQPTLGSKVRDRFPAATPEQLAGLRIGPSRIVGRELRQGTSQPVDLIYVRCSITLKRTDPTSAPILDYCEELVEAELARQHPDEAAA